VAVFFVSQIAVLPDRKDQPGFFQLADMAAYTDEAGVFGLSGTLEGEIIYCGKLEVVDGLEEPAFGVGVSWHIIIYIIIMCNLVLKGQPSLS
jgi:hypothetical protein